MKKICFTALLVMFFAVCGYCEENKAINKSPFSFLQGFVMGDEYVQYQSDLVEIESSYKKGEISEEKYMELKSDAEKKYKIAGRHGR